jgi:hypothetical protein
MKQAKMLELIKQWKALERRGKDLDFEMSRWCADLRAEFPAGAGGDRMCSQWLDTELAMAPGKKEEILARAAAFAFVSDAAQWDALGGFAQIRHLLPLPKPERVAVLGAAKTSGYRIGTIIRGRQAKLEAQQLPQRPPSDVQILAEFIEQLGSVPDEIREVARRHVRAKALNVAA